MSWPMYEFLPTALDFFQSTGDQVDLVLEVIDQLLGRHTAAQGCPQLTAVASQLSTCHPCNIVYSVYVERVILVAWTGYPLVVLRKDGTTNYKNCELSFPTATRVTPGVYQTTTDVIITRGICGIWSKGDDINTSWVVRANAEVIRIADIIDVARDALPLPIFEAFALFFFRSYAPVFT